MRRWRARFLSRWNACSTELTLLSLLYFIKQSSSSLSIPHTKPAHHAVATNEPEC